MFAGNPRVLFTGGDTTGVLAAVRALREAGYEPWVGSSPRGYAARSRAAAGRITLPDGGTDPAGFVRRLRAAGERHGLAAVLGGTERDLIAIARRREELGELAAGTPSLDSMLRITNKIEVNALARQVGLRVPPSVEVERGRLSELSGLELPVVIKPVRSELETRNGTLRHADVVNARTLEQLRRLDDTLPGDRWLVQECVPGRLGAICGVAWKGQLITAVHQVAHRIWPAEVGVSAYAQTVAPDHSLEAQVAELLGRMGWTGIFQTQFIHGPDGSYLIDMNPRIYGWLALATAAGANLPAIWVSLLAGEATRSLKVRPYTIGVRYRAKELDLRALLYLARNGSLGLASRGLFPHRHTVHSVLRLSDPLPVMTTFGKLVRRTLPAVKHRGGGG